MLLEPASSLTDFALGGLSIAAAFGLAGRGPVGSPWRWFFLFTGLTAIWGGVHHGFLPSEGTAAGLSWSGITIGVALAISFALSSSIVTVLGPGKGKPMIAIRGVCLVAFVVLVLLGRASVPTLLVTEGLAMLMIVGLWLHAWGQAHPGSGMVLTAIFVSILAAAARGGDASFTMGGLGVRPQRRLSPGADAGDFSYVHRSAPALQIPGRHTLAWRRSQINQRLVFYRQRSSRFSFPFRPTLLRIHAIRGKLLRS